jgi:ribosome-associated protein
MTEFDTGYDDNGDEWAFEKSKTQIKQELLAIKEIGRQLIELPIADLKKVDMPEDIMDAVVSAQAMKKIALKRQIGYVGGLLADADYESIEKQIAQLKLPHQGNVKAFHQLEAWRDRLLDQDKAVFSELMAEFDDFDMQHVRQLVRNAANEAKNNKPPKSARQLFKYLQDLQANQ